MLGPITNDLLEKAIEKFNDFVKNDDNKKLLDPWLDYIISKLKSYIVIITILFLLSLVIAIAIFGMLIYYLPKRSMI